MVAHTCNSGLGRAWLGCDKPEASLGYSVLQTRRGMLRDLYIIPQRVYFKEKPGLESQFKSQPSFQWPPLPRYRKLHPSRHSARASPATSSKRNLVLNDWTPGSV